MATWVDLAGYRQYVVRSDGAKFRDGERDDNLDTSWLTISPTVSLGPGLYDELMVIPRVADEDEIKAWAQAGAPWYDPSPVIDAGAQNIRARGTGGAIAIDEQGIRARRYSDNRQVLNFNTNTGNLAIAGDLTGSAGDFANGKVRIGDIAGKQWGDGTLPSGTAGIWGEGAGLYLRGYARLLDADYGVDEHLIDLSDFPNLNDPKVLVAPKEVIVNLPALETPSYLFVDAVRESDTAYRIKVKTILKEGGSYSWGTRSKTTSSWSYTRPTDSVDGKKGVYTNFIFCRPTWELVGSPWEHTARLWMYITDQFDASGNPINWQQVKTFSRTSAKGQGGTLNWDISLPYFGQWACRVGGEGYKSLGGVEYAYTGLSSFGYRTQDTYLDINGNRILTDDPANTSSGMSALYMVFDRG